MKTDERSELLDKLIKFSAPLAEIKLRLYELVWDFDGQPLELGSYHLIGVLRRYLSDELNCEEVTEWANIIEMRDDIEIGNNIGEFMHELANPNLEGHLDKVRANQIIHAISREFRNQV